MLSLISPAKSQDFSQNAPTGLTSKVLFAEQITQLVDKLKHYTPDEFACLMKISPKLAEGVFDMYINFDSKHYGKDNAKQALFAFTGDVYRGLNALTLSPAQINYAQEHLLMISGLYGLIRPLDLIQAYRLEMGTKFYIDGVLLYDFWRETLTQKLNDIIKAHNHQAIVNLASNEYSKAIDKKMIKTTWLEVDFKEFHKGKYQTIALFAKRARGKMVRYIIDHNINNVEALKGFDYDGYVFNPEFSRDKSFCFTRVKP
ncbi:peroxide stress protein YaaA [Cysteiniphilum halobium]|uniref:peroxide stress protein YaaA n=1 Tax=Cysteiniphilum halobium TaxID=2219059 RepID=UPI000E65897F|nr:peroxide stress protein YaaA [Cysteiniphilum halobium]